MRPGGGCVASPCKVCGEWVCTCQARALGYGLTSAQQYQPGSGSAGLAQVYGQQAQMRPAEPQPDPRLKGLTERLARLLRHRETFLTYIRDRLEDGDFHACSDGANDMRELECEIRCVEEMIELVGGKVT